MFKLLAIRPLEGCAQHIQKCLKTGMMYYFCNDYIIEPGSHIRRRSKNIKPLKDDFFTVVSESDYSEDNSSKEKSPTVSVSAIVGMNGDGKSTLVELMMRLINNCAITYNLCASADNLRCVKDVKAELYYMVDNVVYRMAGEEKPEETWIWKVAELNAGLDDNDIEVMRWKLEPKKVNSVEDDAKCFFFTIVSNYSHYAYNVYDYQKEWEVRGDEKDDDEKCWLHYIFHKNDGYLTPITLHPYRYKGNIDINVEKELSKQRLLSLFLNAENPKENDHSFRRVNGKDANVLKLTEEKESKLQQKAIIDFFKTTSNQGNRYKELIDNIKRFEDEIDLDDMWYNPRYEEKYGSFDFYDEWLEDKIRIGLDVPINQIIGQDTNFSKFVSKIVTWIKTSENIVLPKTGEIGLVLNSVNKLYLKTIHYKEALAYNYNANVYFAKGDYDKALEYYNLALTISELKIGRDHPLTARICFNIAGVLKKKKKYAKAVVYYNRVRDVYYKLAEICHNKGNDNKASEYRTTAKNITTFGYPLSIGRLLDENEIKELKKNKWESITKPSVLYEISTLQLGRLDTLYRIIKSYGIDWRIVTKDYSELSVKEKCQHYIIYKIWSILSTYPQFRKAFQKDNSESIRECGDALEECIKEIVNDDQSHITRKLRQVKSFMNEKLHDGGLYDRLGKKDKDTGDLLIEIDELKKHYEDKFFSLDKLPPPIYKWDILFNRIEDPAHCDIGLDSFSSGEKQKLNSIGAIVYHLQNLAHTASEVKYNNVNLIMEEIELYYHPEYQRQFFNELLIRIKGADLGNIQNINLVFVTHSPFILSDIPKCNVLFLKEGMPDDELQENTFGANIHSLLKHGFFMPNLPIGEFAYRKINALFKKLNTGDFTNDDEEKRKEELAAIYQQILLVGEPFLRNQLLLLFNAFKGSKIIPTNL